MANHNRTIHLLPPPQSQPDFDPADIASETMSIIWELRCALMGFMECANAFDADMSYRLDELERVCLRRFAAKGKH